MPSLTRAIRSFVAVDDAGRRHTLAILVGAHGDPSPSDPFGKIPGPRRIVGEAGQEVVRIALGEYVTAAGVRLTSDDPDAV